MEKNDEYKICECCKIGIIKKDIYDICSECGWEDDPFQNDEIDFSGGANELSLIDHRKRYFELKKKNPKYKWINTIK